MISFILVDVPITKPASPIKAITTFLNTKIARDNPAVESQYVQNSRKAGIVRPSVLSVKAPGNM